MRLLLILSASLFLTFLAPPATVPAAAAPAVQIRDPEGGEVRGFVIGIDAYQHVRPLKGAVADAHDIEHTLKEMGVHDVVTMINEQANRAQLLRELSAMVARTNPNDLIFLSIAGHGTREPERVKGSQPNGLENVFLLPGVPEAFRTKLDTVRQYVRGSRPFVSRAAYTNLDEAELKPALDAVVAAHAGVDVGSYPRWFEPTYKTKVTFDAREEALVSAALADFVERLPAGALVRTE